MVAKIIPHRKEYKRKHTRFSPEGITTAQIDFKTGNKKFEPEVAALISQESQSGCGLVAMADERFAIGAVFRVRVGSLLPLLAQIVWVKVVDEQIVKFGVKYLE